MTQDTQNPVSQLDVEIARWQAEDRRLATRPSLAVPTPRCKRLGCNLPAEFDGWCEPCWEIGRDEL